MCETVELYQQLKPQVSYGSEYSDSMDWVRVTLGTFRSKLDELKEYSPLFDADVYDAISLHTCVDMRSTVGGPSPDAVQAALDDANAWMSKYARD